MPESQRYDYIIVGSGMAGLQLALEFSKHSFFETKQIALIDKFSKDTNDKTWSFWEKGLGQWDDIVYKSWHKAIIRTNKTTLNLPLDPYNYKSVRSIDFYTLAKKALTKKNNFHFIIDSISDIKEDTLVKVIGKQSSYEAQHVFDSRVPESYSISKGHIRIIQHFKGIVIKTENPIFNQDEFTMMDYRIKDGEQTTFTYVLPYSSKEALIEFTYFTSELVDENTYDHYIERYISKYLHLSEYEIIETEQGRIPMTDFNFKKYSSKNITKIGTGGGWVKGSTGYSFKNTEKKVQKIVENIMADRRPSEGLNNKRFLFYDRIFLKVLEDENEKGEWIFEQFYKKNDITTMFRFLDEESNIWEELKIMKSLFSWSFIRAFFKTL